jgi:hypothetical protein
MFGALTDRYGGRADGKFKIQHFKFRRWDTAATAAGIEDWRFRFKISDIGGETPPLRPIAESCRGWRLRN